MSRLRAYYEPIVFAMVLAGCTSTARPPDAAPPERATAASANQGSQSVVVANSTSQPIPAAQSGDWNVGISGTPTVNAQQAGAPWSVDIGSPTVTAAQGGSWNVGITGTPTVNVVNPASGSLGVTVGNTVQASIQGTPAVTVDSSQSAATTSTIGGGAAKNAILTVNAYEGRQPFFRGIDAFSGGPCSNCAAAAYQLALGGKRLVLEYVSVEIVADHQPSSVHLQAIDPNIGSVGVAFMVPVLIGPESTGATTNVYAVNQQLKMYLDDRVTIQVVAVLSAPGNVSASFYLHGYLIDP
jgi:hypothetical protein